jgi:hypothetical protein
MNRRAFLGALLGAGAVVATEAVAPSLVWPFRKYFLPSNWARWWIGLDWAGNLQTGCIPPGSLVTTQGFTHLSNNGIWQVTDAEVTLFDKTIPDLYGHGISEEMVEAIELESFAKEIPDLIFKPTPMYKYIKSRRTIEVSEMELAGARAHFNAGLDAILADGDVPQSFTNKVLGIPRQKYPMHKKLLHKKATVENIVRFVDDLQSKG